MGIKHPREEGQRRLQTTNSAFWRPLSVWGAIVADQRDRSIGVVPGYAVDFGIVTGNNRLIIVLSVHRFFAIPADEGSRAAGTIPGGSRTKRPRHPLPKTRRPATTAAAVEGCGC
jgi:hypothetical protein